MGTRPDVVLELSWRYGLIEYCMPYMVQTFRTFNNKLDSLYQKIELQEKKIEDDQKKEQDEQMNNAAKNMIGTRLMLTGPGIGGQPSPNMAAPPQFGANQFGQPQQGQMFGGAPQQFGGGGQYGGGL